VARTADGNSYFTVTCYHQTLAISAVIFYFSWPLVEPLAGATGPLGSAISWLKTNDDMNNMFVVIQLQIYFQL